MPKTLGELEQLILLGLVALGDDAYGAAIRREIVSRTAREVSAGAIYTVLERLESAGLVASRVGQPTAERGGRRRKHYRLRREGAHALHASRQRMRQMEAGLALDLPGLLSGAEA